MSLNMPSRLPTTIKMVPRPVTLRVVRCMDAFLTNSELKSVKGVLVDLLQLLPHLDGEVD